MPAAQVPPGPQVPVWQLVPSGAALRPDRQRGWRAPAGDCGLVGSLVQSAASPIRFARASLPGNSKIPNYNADQTLPRGMSEPCPGSA